MKNKDYQLYIDLDGVLVDFNGGYVDNYKKSKGTLTNYDEKEARKAYSSTGSEFWVDLKWIHGGKELWKSATSLFERVYILSSAGSGDPTRGKEIVKGKRLWINKNIPELDQEKVFIVMGKDLKPQFANKASILIDDMPITIQRWNKEGGFGILHNSNHYKRTIEDLEDIAGPIKLSELVKRFRH
jgi:5'(3')-deoxyribonucleotidase